MREQLLRFLVETTGSQMEYHVISQLIEEALLSEKVTRHPYGFLILRVPWLNPDWQLRLHIWLQGNRMRQTPDWPAHTHNSQLHSFVWTGSVINREAVFIPTARECGAVYEVTYNGSVSTLEKTASRGRLIWVHEAWMTPGEHYEVRRDQFHVTDVDASKHAATIVLMGTRTVGRSLVFGDADGPELVQFDRTAIDSDSVAQTKAILTDYFVIDR
jgi:hypothetical protein